MKAEEHVGWSLFRARATFHPPRKKPYGDLFWALAGIVRLLLPSHYSTAVDLSFEYSLGTERSKCAFA
jgi:hypothetical protein